MTTLKQILDEQAQLESKAGTPTVLFPTEEWEIAYLNGGLSGLVYEKMCAYVGPDHPFHCRLLISDAIKIVMLATHAAQIRADVLKMKQALEFYANTENYNKEEGSVIDMQPRGLNRKMRRVLDFGDRARAVLDELGFGGGE